MFKNWFKIFIYNSIKNKGFTFLTIFGLAIGITGVIFSTLYWDDETSYDQWNPNKDNVFEVIIDMQNIGKWAIAPEPLAKNVLLKTDKVESYCYLEAGYTANVYDVKNKKEYLNKSISTQSNFFDFFPFEFVKGSKKAFEQNRDGIAIEENEAKRLFGDEDPINQTITSIDGAQKTIYGVYKLDKKSSLAPKYIFSDIYNSLKYNEDQWGNFNYSLLLKLKRPEDKADVENTIRQVYITYRIQDEAKSRGMSVEEYMEKTSSNFTIELQPLAVARLSDNVTGFLEGKGNRLFLQITLGLSVLILVLSIINYVNLSTAQAIRRAKEVGVRKVLGASKQNIVSQFVFETTLITLFSTLFALCMAELSLPYYNNLINKTLELNFGDHWFYLVLIVLTVIVFAGIFPALYISNFDVLKVLKGNFARSKSGVWLRNGMLIIQFAIATFFIVGGFIVTNQMTYIAKKDLGFSGDQVLQINYNRFDLGDKRYAFYEGFKQDLLKIKGVKDVNITSFIFGSGASSTSTLNKANSDAKAQASLILSDFGLFEMLKIELKEGRFFDPKIASDTVESIILNERAVQDLGEDVPLGTEFQWNGYKTKLIGIVKNFHLLSPAQEYSAMSFMHVKTPKWYSNLSGIMIKIDSENADETLADIEKFWKQKVDQNYPFEYDFVNNQFARSYQSYTQQEAMFKILNIVVIIIALFGLFALSSYTIERKYKEIAIRKVLGAETGSLLKSLSKQYVYYAIIGFVLAVFPSYILMQKWLENFAYRIDISITVYIFAFVLLLALTLIVVLLKAYSATRINLLNYLKYE